MRVSIVAQLRPETAVPVLHLRESLSIFKDLKNPNAWSGRFRGSPARFPQEDGRIIEAAISDAVENPISRSYDERKLKRRPKSVVSGIGEVTVPEIEDESGSRATPAMTEHTSVQSMLLQMGNAMGLGVWVAPGDKSKHKGEQASGFVDELPRQFDEATSRTVRNIDVLLLDGSSIVAAFEIESTTAIYSGLLRMADLVAMQPNLSIPLYLVAPDERRDKVIAEVNRPAFANLPQPFSQIVSYIPFAALREKFDAIQGLLHHIRPSILEEVAETCEPEEA